MDLLGPQTQTATLSLLFLEPVEVFPAPDRILKSFSEASPCSHQGLPGTVVGRHLWETHIAGKKQKELQERKKPFASISASPPTSPLCFFTQIYPLCAWKNSWELLNKGFLPKEALTGRRKLGRCSSREL